MAPSREQLYAILDRRGLLPPQPPAGTPLPVVQAWRIIATTLRQTSSANDPARVTLAMPKVMGAVLRRCPRGVNAEHVTRALDIAGFEVRTPRERAGDVLENAAKTCSEHFVVRNEWSIPLETVDKVWVAAMQEARRVLEANEGTITVNRFSGLWLLDPQHAPRPRSNYDTTPEDALLLSRGLFHKHLPSGTQSAPAAQATPEQEQAALKQRGLI